MSVFKSIHPRDYTDRISRFRKGRIGLASIEDCVDASIQRLEDFIKNNKEGLITAAKTQH